MRRTNPLIKSALATIIASAAVHSSASVAAQGEPANLTQASQAKVSFEIDAPRLSRALIQLTEQSGMQLIYPAVNAETDLPANPIKGRYTTGEALDRLLKGTGLNYEFIDERTISVFAKSNTLVKTSSTSTAPEAKLIRLASNASDDQTKANAQEQAPSSDSLTAGSASVGRSRSTNSENLEHVIVTGSNIRGIDQKFSPVITTTREELDRRGIASTGDYVAQLPQNFNNISADTGSGSVAGAVGVNLRGLGTESTLVLLNGRRLASAGAEGAFTDISGIPVSALERVDVLTDGASAIYGSDAIAGVVNFILRKDYNGAETRMRVAHMADSDSYQVGQTFGISTERGRALLSYEYSSDDGLDANDRSFTKDFPDPYTILPKTKQHSAFFSGALNLTDGLEVFSDAFWSSRKSEQTNNLYLTSLNVSEPESRGGTLGGRVDQPGGWQAELSGSVAQSDWNLWAYTIPSTHEWGAGSVRTNASNVWSLDAKADGALFDLRGGTVRAVLGAQYREEDYDGWSDFLDVNYDLVDQRYSDADKARNVSALFAEVYAPLVGASNAMTGVKELAVSLAARYEDYSDFGTSLNPKVGVMWSPLDSVTLRATYGRSFRAPLLSNLVDRINYVALLDYLDPESPGGRAVAVMPVGNRSDLDAEKSRSWSVGIDWQPAFAPRLDARMSYFDIDYTGRVGVPFPEVNFATFEWYDHPLPVQRTFDMAEVQRFLALSGLPLNNFTWNSPDGVEYELSDATLLVDARMTNTQSSRVSGLDLDVGYGLPLADGHLQLSVNAAYFIDAEDQFSSLRPVVRKVGRMFTPARFRAMAGASWSRGAMSTSLYTRYTGGYTDQQTVPSSRISSWTLFDLSFQYHLERGAAPALLAGTKLSLTVQNVFDKDPPRISMIVAPTAGERFAPYDAQNADPQGRVIALQIMKEWGGR